MEKAITDSAELASGTAAPLTKTILIPSEGEYKLKSFVWDMDDMYRYCEAKELISVMK